MPIKKDNNIPLFLSLYFTFAFHTQMTAVKGSNESHGYCQVGLPELSQRHLYASDLSDLPQYPLSSYTPIVCGDCNTRFHTEMIRIWRETWVRSPIVNYDGDQSMNSAWVVCDDYLRARGYAPLGVCCREKLHTWVAFDLLHEAYKSANEILPSDWTYDLHIKEAGLEDTLPLPNQGNQSQFKPGTSLSNGLWYDTHSVSASQTFYNNPRLYRLGLNKINKGVK